MPAGDIARKIGIGPIGVALPERRVSTAALAASLGVDAARLEGRLGFRSLARKGEQQQSSDLAVQAVRHLIDQGVDIRRIECLCAVTQNPDGTGIPPLSAIVHGRLALPQKVAAFDLAHGCAGFVHAVALTKSFMLAQGYLTGLVITCDPYSAIVDPNDYQTALIFGDAACVTVLSTDYTWQVGKITFGTAGAYRDSLVRDPQSHLAMNGKRIARFCASVVPESILEAVELNGFALGDMELVLLHQASRYIVESIGTVLGASERTPFYAAEYGNTVSSSLPLALALHVPDSVERVALSGFGVGLSWASTVLTRATDRKSPRGQGAGSKAVLALMDGKRSA